MNWKLLHTLEQIILLNTSDHYKSDANLTNEAEQLKNMDVIHERNLSIPAVSIKRNKQSLTGKWYFQKTKKRFSVLLIGLF